MSEIVAERIKQRRKELGLSQDDLAKKLEIERSTVSKWESGKTNLKQSMVVKLANVLDCSPIWIAGLDYTKLDEVDIPNKIYTSTIFGHKTYHVNDVEPIEHLMNDMDYDQVDRLRKYAEWLLTFKKKKEDGKNED